MNTNQPISAARAAVLMLELLPSLARVELYPQWSDGTGVVVRRTRAVPYDAAGAVMELLPMDRAAVSAVLRRVGDVDLDRPQSLDVVSGEVSAVEPPVVPLWLSVGLAAERVDVAEWRPNGGHDAGCAYVGGIGPCTCAPAAVPDPGALLEQRHQLEDPAEPPLAVAVPEATAGGAA